jgi:hypothetical protein
MGEIQDTAYNRAAKAGSLKVIKWLIEERGWNEHVVLGVALGERWEILQNRGFLQPSEKSSELVALCA